MHDETALRLLAATARRAFQVAVCPVQGCPL